MHKVFRVLNEPLNICFKKLNFNPKVAPLQTLWCKNNDGGKPSKTTKLILLDSLLQESYVGKSGQQAD
jgi:hypothetical protein